MTIKKYVTAEVKTHSDNMAKVASLLNQLAKNSLQESGCEHYQILQRTDDTNSFMTFEIWESAEAERQHWEMEHLKNTLNQLNPLLLEAALIKTFKTLG